MAANIVENQCRRFVDYSISGHQNLCTAKIEAAASVKKTRLRPNLLKKRETPTKFTDVVTTANKKRMFH